ncbi:MAG: hypothetical protein JWO94_3169 [Verrucomicrobiaceae bacterium]|nr:hypothetical protein [Verrucomicrobiaceae bacterium]
MKFLPFSSTFLLASLTLGLASEPATGFKDPHPQRYDIAARASKIDPNAMEHPEINFVFSRGAKPSDIEHAAVDTRVQRRGKLVIWLMGYPAPLFDRVTSYGLHAIQVHYANGWFGQFGNDSPGTDGQLLGNIRLEAATGEDVSPLVSIPKPDGMMERAHQFVKWLASHHPEGQWDQFLTADGNELRWDKVIISGASHGSTTAARFAKYQKVDRVVTFCGPRDQYESWQALPSATPANRYFAFSHVLDSGWTGGHYCRSWEMLGLNQFGPIVNIDESKPPYGNTRRLITKADVKGDANRAHGSVVPGAASPKNAAGEYLDEDVWRYLFTAPVEVTGSPVPADDACLKELPKEPKGKKKTQSK